MIFIKIIITIIKIPVVKTPLPFNDVVYDPLNEGKQFTLYSGTMCIETRYHLKDKIPVLAMVTETGFNTMKGVIIINF